LISPLPIPTTIETDYMSTLAGADEVPAAEQDAPVAAEAAVAAAAVAPAAAPTAEVDEHPLKPTQETTLRPYLKPMSI
jgi:hypothetical protein